MQKIDSDIFGALRGEFSMSSDKQLARIQASVLATCAPVINLWSQLEDQGLSGKPNDLFPVSEVLKISSNWEGQHNPGNQQGSDKGWVKTLKYQECGIITL